MGDPWVDGKLEPTPVPSYSVGIRHRDKLLIVRWLQREYRLTHDEAMRDADSLEKYLEVNR